MSTQQPAQQTPQEAEAALAEQFAAIFRQLDQGAARAYREAEMRRPSAIRVSARTYERLVRMDNFAAMAFGEWMKTPDGFTLGERMRRGIVDGFGGKACLRFRDLVFCEWLVVSVNEALDDATAHIVEYGVAPDYKEYTFAIPFIVVEE